MRLNCQKLSYRPRRGNVGVPYFGWPRYLRGPISKLEMVSCTQIHQYDRTNASALPRLRSTDATPSKNVTI